MAGRRGRNQAALGGAQAPLWVLRSPHFGASGELSRSSGVPGPSGPSSGAATSATRDQPRSATAAGDVELDGDTQALVGLGLAEIRATANAARGASLTPPGIHDETPWWK